MGGEESADGMAGSVITVEGSEGVGDGGGAFVDAEGVWALMGGEESADGMAGSVITVEGSEGVGDGGGAFVDAEGVWALTGGEESADGMAGSVITVEGSEGAGDGGGAFVDAEGVWALTGGEESAEGIGGSVIAGGGARVPSGGKGSGKEGVSMIAGQTVVASSIAKESSMGMEVSSAKRENAKISDNIYPKNLKNRLLGLAKAPIIDDRKLVRIALIRTNLRRVRSSILGSFRSSRKTDFSGSLGLFCAHMKLLLSLKYLFVFVYN